MDQIIEIGSKIEALDVQIKALELKRFALQNKYLSLHGTAQKAVSYSFTQATIKLVELTKQRQDLMLDFSDVVGFRYTPAKISYSLNLTK
jgi:hypothetical protein